MPKEDSNRDYRNPTKRFTYGFDDIGNRKTAGSGGDQQGANLHVQNYTANILNQYTTRTVPGFADVTDSANSNATVTVWGNNGASAQSIRQGEHFYAALPVDNSSAPLWLTLTNMAVLPNGTNPDIVTNTTGKALLAKTPESFTYDLDGNLTSDSLWANTWNAENRRTLVESRTTVPTAARARELRSYLPDGRWIERIVSAWNGSVWVLQYTNRYIWDGQVLMAVLDHTNGVVLSFLRGLDLSGSMRGAGGVGSLLAVSQISNSHFACFDGNGNVMGLVAAVDGTISAEYEYGPFGEVIRATGPMAKANPIRWSTKYTDDETDLVMYPYRPFSPSLGRWLSHDPIEEKGGPNLYGFTGNSPICLIDPDGRMTLREFSFALPQPPTRGPYTGYGGLTWFNAFEPKARVYKSIDGPCCWKVIVPGYADLYYWWVVIVPGALQHEMLHVSAHRDTYRGFNNSASRFVGNCYSEPKAKCYQGVINGVLKAAWLASNHTKNLLIDQSYRSGEIAQAMQEEQSAWNNLAQEETKCEQIK